LATRLILVDTTVLVDLLRGLPAARDFLVQVDRPLVASELTRIEILRGLRSGERAGAERAFRAFRWVAVDEAIARRAGELGRHWRASHAGIGVVDLVIAATALELDADLATSSVRHYPMFPDLQPPYPRGG
jgi:predicted nucleic acid-binding protein